jgi:DNA polymerase-3 subunit gamma/tau
MPVTPALQPTDEAQPIEPRPVPVIAEDIEQASEKVTEFITPIAEVISTADHQQTNTSVVEPPVVEVANEISPIEPELEIEAVNSSITEEPEQQSDPLSDVTHSRNMLRSHRLKRNESKKSLATTDLQINEPVVAADVKNNTENVQAESALKKTEPEKVAQEANNSNFDSTSNDRTQDLSALEAKLDEPHVNDHNDNNMNSYMENYSQHEMDNQANQYAEAEFEPYIPFEELQTNAPVSVEPIIPEVIRDNALPAQGSLGEHAFFSDQPFEAVELDRAGYVEDKLTDPWSLAIKEMGVKGLVKLLAKNCVMSKIEKQIVLTLKPDQQHLLNNSGLCEELQLQLKNYYGTQFSMYIEVGDVEGKLTAFESEMALYEQYLDNAKRAIVEDENIKALVTNCGAKVYENSVIPL